MSAISIKKWNVIFHIVLKIKFQQSQFFESSQVFSQGISYIEWSDRLRAACIACAGEFECGWHWRSQYTSVKSFQAHETLHKNIAPGPSLGTPALGYLFHWCASRKYLFLHFTFPNIPAANNNNPMGFLYEQGDSWNSLPANSLKTLQYLGKSCLRWWT